MPTRSSSIACWPLLITASAGDGTGSTWFGSARARATRPTCRASMPGPIATMSSARSTSDTPFPRFVAEQLAGDALLSRSRGGWASPRQSDWLTQAATGFLVGGTHDIVGNQTVEGMRQQRVDDLDDMITATGTAFLGLTVNCARCHDHKFDPITQQRLLRPAGDLRGCQPCRAPGPRADAQARAAEASCGRRRAGDDRAPPRRVRAPGASRSRHATPPHGQPQAQRRAVRPGQGADGFA